MVRRMKSFIVIAFNTSLSPPGIEPRSSNQYCYLFCDIVVKRGYMWLWRRLSECVTLIELLCDTDWSPVTPTESLCDTEPLCCCRQTSGRPFCTSHWSVSTPTTTEHRRALMFFLLWKFSRVFCEVKGLGDMTFTPKITQLEQLFNLAWQI
jgi:hypothetical protein